MKAQRRGRARSAASAAGAAASPTPPHFELEGAWARRRSWLVPTQRAGVQTRLYADPGPLHGVRLEDRQLEAAALLAQIWREAQAGLERPRGLRTHGPGGEPTAEEEALAAVAWKGYGAALEAVRARCGTLAVIAVRAAVIEHAACDQARALAGLAALADHWGLL